jgi:hypothetical protein
MRDWNLSLQWAQALSGIYCALFGTWTYFNPRSMQIATSVAQSGEMKMPLPLTIGLVCLGLSVAAPPVLHLIERYRMKRIIKTSQENLPAWSGFESEQVWRESIAFQNKLIELGRSIDGVLNPIQIDAIRLATDLRKFTASVGPRPVVDKSKFPSTQQGIIDHLREVHRVLDPWEEMVRAKYELDFQDRVEELRKRFAAEGLPSDSLREEVCGADVRRLIESIASELWRLASKFGAKENVDPNLREL